MKRQTQIILTTLAVLICCTVFVTGFNDQTDAEEITYEYSVKNNNLGFSVTYNIADVNDDTVFNESIANNATATTRLEPGFYTFTTVKDGTVLDIRTGTIDADFSTSIGKYGINRNGIKAEAGAFTATVTHVNPAYEITSAVTNINGITVDSDHLDSAIFAYVSDTIIADIVPENPGYAEYIAGSTFTGSGNLMLYLYPAIERSITVFSGVDLFIGMKIAHFVDFKEISPASSLDNGDGTTTYKYNLASNSTYGLRANDPTDANHITFASNLKFGSDTFTSLDLTAPGLMTVSGKNSRTVTETITANADIADMYANCDHTGAVYLGVGDTAKVDTFRTFQALDTITSNYFIEPVYNYSALSNDGVITIGSDGTITANKTGTAYVIVTYNAMNYLIINSPTLGTPTFYGACAPANTYVIAVSVTASGDAPALSTNITVNDRLASDKLIGSQVDCDVDIFYFLRENGEFIYTFTPEAGSTVSVLNPVLSDGTITSFSEGRVINNNGTFSISLKEGRNVVAVTKDGQTAYQIMRAAPITIDVTNTTSQERDTEGKVAPGDVLEISISGAYDLHKLAGVYNPQAGATVQLVDNVGNKYIPTNTTKQYALPYTTVLYTITVPGGISDTFALGGYISSAGFGDPACSHHLISSEYGKGANFNALMRNYVMGSVAGPTFEVVDYYTLTYDTKENIEILFTNPTKTAMGGSYNFGTMDIKGNDAVIYFNSANYTLVAGSTVFTKDGQPTTVFGLNSGKIEVDGTSIAAKRAVVAEDLEAGIYTFKVVYGNAMSQITYTGTIVVSEGTYTFEKYVIAGASTTLEDMPAKALAAAEAENKQFSGWLVNGELKSAGWSFTPTSNMSIPAAFSADYTFILKDSVKGKINGTYTGVGINAVQALSNALDEAGIPYGFNPAATSIIFETGSISDWVCEWRSADSDCFGTNVAVWNYSTANGWFPGNTFGTDPGTVFLISYERFFVPTGESAVAMGITSDGSGSFNVPAGLCVSDGTGVHIAPMDLNAAPEDLVFEPYFFLTFDSNGGSPVGKIAAKAGTAVSAPAVPTRSGYDFIRWSSALPSVMPSNDALFVAEWMLVPVPSEDGGYIADAKNGGSFVVPESVSGKTLIIDMADDSSITIADSGSLAGKTVNAKIDKVENLSDKKGQAFEFIFTADGASYNGTMLVTVAYDVGENGTPHVYYWDGDKSVEMKIVSYTSDSITFETQHNSIYIVSSESKVDYGMWPPAIIVAIFVVVGIWFFASGRKTE